MYSNKYLLSKIALVMAACLLCATLSSQSLSREPTPEYKQELKASTRPASTKPAAKTEATTRPSTRPNTKPVNVEPTTNIAATTLPSTRPMVFKAVPEPMPQNTGWLSFALYEDQIWLDKKFLGQGVIAYMRVGSGRRAVELRHPKWGVESFVLNVRHGQHLTVVRRAKRVGVGQVRGEQSYVSVRRYQSGQAPSEEIRDPGPYCIKQDDCPFLTPGEQLYISPDGSYQIMPSINSTMAVRPYRANSDDGFLTLYSYPPGALFINDKLYAMSPVARLPLRPGNYQVYIRNGFMDMEWRGKVNIISGNEQRQVVSLYPKGGSNLQIMSVAPAQIYINQLYRGWTPLRVMPLVAGKHHVYLLRPNGQNKTWHVSLKPNSIHTLKWLSDAPPNPTNSPTDPTDAPPTK